MRKEREIVIEFVRLNRTNNHKLAEYFARKYSEKLQNENRKKKG